MFTYQTSYLLLWSVVFTVLIFQAMTTKRLNCSQFNSLGFSIWIWITVRDGVNICMYMHCSTYCWAQALEPLCSRNFWTWLDLLTSVAKGSPEREREMLFTILKWPVTSSQTKQEFVVPQFENTIPLEQWHPCENKGGWGWLVKMVNVMPGVGQRQTRSCLFPGVDDLSVKLLF